MGVSAGRDRGPVEKLEDGSTPLPMANQSDFVPHDGLLKKRVELTTEDGHIWSIVIVAPGSEVLTAPVQSCRRSFGPRARAFVRQIGYHGNRAD